jgi:hypothetical protein
LIHSSHGRKTVSVSNSAKITKIPEITAICVAVESRSNRRAHGEMHNQRPNSQLRQSSHCFGSENPTAIEAPVKSAIPKNLWGKSIKTPTKSMAALHVRYWHKADISYCTAHVCF